MQIFIVKMNRQDVLINCYQLRLYKSNNIKKRTETVRFFRLLSTMQALKGLSICNSAINRY